VTHRSGEVQCPYLRHKLSLYFCQVSFLRSKEMILITQDEKFQKVNVVDVFSAATGWTVRCLNPVNHWICPNRNAYLKMGDVFGRN